jgi:AcrR family transcriptional regulator
LLTQLNNAPKFQRQGAIHSRTEAAILETTKNLIAQKGLSATTMIDISVESQVSRATLYNHYRDKNAVVLALLTSELHRLRELMHAIGTPAAVLEKLSLEISSSEALKMMRLSDPTALAFALTESSGLNFMPQFSKLLNLKSVHHWQLLGLSHKCLHRLLRNNQLTRLRY